MSGSNNIVFPFEKEKAIQAALWLLKRNNGAMDKLQLVKLYFLADREHLIKYGRPIAGGSYYAMDHGPVCSELLDLLKEIQSKGEFEGFQTQGKYNILAKDTPDRSFLSNSDLDVLDSIYAEYGHIDKWSLKELTHKLNAYKKNEPAKGSRRPLPYEDFFEDLKPSERGMLEIIRDEQNAWADFI